MRYRKISSKREFTVMSSYIKKSEGSQKNKLMMHLKVLEKQKQDKPQISRWKEILKIRTKTNEIETKTK
jgi:hypothetical protein